MARIIDTDENIGIVCCMQKMAFNGTKIDWQSIVTYFRYLTKIKQSVKIFFKHISFVVCLHLPKPLTAFCCSFGIFKWKPFIWIGLLILAEHICDCAGWLFWSSDHWSFSSLAYLSFWLMIWEREKRWQSIWLFQTTLKNWDAVNHFMNYNPLALF